MLGVVIKHDVGDGDLKTLVPRIVGQTEQARIQKPRPVPSIDVDWKYDEERLEPERLAIRRRRPALSVLVVAVGSGCLLAVGGCQEGAALTIARKQAY